MSWRMISYAEDIIYDIICLSTWYHISWHMMSYYRYMISYVDIWYQGVPRFQMSVDISAVPAPCWPPAADFHWDFSSASDSDSDRDSAAGVTWTVAVTAWPLLSWQSLASPCLTPRHRLSDSADWLGERREAPVGLGGRKGLRLAAHWQWLTIQLKLRWIPGRAGPGCRSGLPARASGFSVVVGTLLYRIRFSDINSMYTISHTISYTYDIL